MTTLASFRKSEDNSMKISSLDELPKFSKWPARLLGLEPWDSKEKTAEEIEREFGREKWGVLLDRFRQNPGSRLEDVDRWVAGDATNTIASVDQHIVEMSPQESHDAYIAFIANAIEAQLPATALVEVGCGYGSVILGIARKAPFQDPAIMLIGTKSVAPSVSGTIPPNGRHRLPIFEHVAQGEHGRTNQGAFRENRGFS